MNTVERLKRIKEIETLVGRVIDKGWRIQSVVYEQRDGEDLQVQLTLTYPPISALQGKL